MATTSSRMGILSGIMCSRRNKCLIATLLITCVFIILILNANLFNKEEAINTDNICKLDEIELQKNFDKAKFAGNWYVTFTKGLDSSLLASLLEFYDVKVNFVLEENGQFGIKSVGGKFLGMWCPEGLGHMIAKDEEFPQKMDISFDTSTGKRFGTKNAWLVKTDYTSYGVLYSCWDKTDDGKCEASSAYAGIIQRSKDALPGNKMDEINTALVKSCIDPSTLRKIKHEGYCKSAQDAIS